jgi:phosphatidylglycerol:prolipoprotein diacylglycerol transferase
LGRFIIEGIRTDTLFIPNTTIPVSQVLALLMLLFAIAMDIVVRVCLKKKEKASPSEDAQ